jgi:uncharacterized protein involved in exopolysaccharide biosynthesis
LDREVTLRDYGRVLWSGRWIILASVVVAGIIGLILSYASTTTYTAKSKVFLGQATTVSGVLAPTPLTSPLTAADVLKGDDLLEAAAARLGVSKARVKRDVSIDISRAPGVTAANQPGVATVTFQDPSRGLTLSGTRVYTDEVLLRLNQNYGAVKRVIQGRLGRAERDVDTYKKQLASLSAEIRRNPSQLPLIQTLLVQTQTLLSTAQSSLDTNALLLAKGEQIEAPSLISISRTASSSGNPTNRARTVLFACIIGLIVGIIITFVWRGSPAGRAAEPAEATK